MSIYEFYQLDINYAQLFVDIIGTTALVITLWLFLRQLRIMQKQLKETSKASNSQNLLTLMNFLQSKEVRNARTHVIKRLESKDYDGWTEKDKDLGATVASSYGSAGVILYTGVPDIKPIIKSWGYSINKTHKILKPLIDERRKEAGPGYWYYYDWLNNKVIASPQAKTFDAADQVAKAKSHD